jgi:hypothetical protein
MQTTFILDMWLIWEVARNFLNRVDEPLVMNANHACDVMVRMIEMDNTTNASMP